MEWMEGRRMLAADATLSAGVLTIDGTSGADNITLTKVGSKLRVKLTAALTKEFNNGSVNTVIVNLFEGNDFFTSYENVTKPMVVYAGTGNDFIVTGGGNDTAYGQGNNDFIQVRSGDDVIDGGTGNDTAYYGDRTYDLSLSLDNVANDGSVGGGHDNIKSNVESLVGGSGDDILTGSNSANYIDGYKGDDSIYGLGGNHTLEGGNGSGSGKHYIDGGTGNDSMEGGDGNDTLFGAAGNDAHLGQGGNDYMSGSSGTDWFKGGSGNDTAFGGIGDDLFYDEAGEDLYEGSDGADEFYADPSNETESDEFYGGFGTDVLSYNGRAHGVRIQTDGVANDGYVGDDGHGPGV
jgi:Ca2+-binding RTX toxin-like protein